MLPTKVMQDFDLVAKPSTLVGRDAGRPEQPNAAGALRWAPDLEHSGAKWSAFGRINASLLRFPATRGVVDAWQTAIP
jgi:hypothetical protein